MDPGAWPRGRFWPRSATLAQPSAACLYGRGAFACPLASGATRLGRGRGRANAAPIARSAPCKGRQKKSPRRAAVTVAPA